MLTALPSGTSFRLITAFLYGVRRRYPILTNNPRGGNLFPYFNWKTQYQFIGLGPGVVRGGGRLMLVLENRRNCTIYIYIYTLLIKSTRAFDETFAFKTIRTLERIEGGRVGETFVIIIATLSLGVPRFAGKGYENLTRFQQNPFEEKSPENNSGILIPRND